MNAPIAVAIRIAEILETLGLRNPMAARSPAR
jgi:hypothetical protein